MKKILIIIFLFCAVFNVAYASNTAEDILLKKQIAQMLIVGFNGSTLTQNNQIYSDIKELGIGGVILFSRNADKTQTKLTKNIQNFNQLKKLNEDLQNISEIPLFISIDQEGGFVSRLSPSYFVVSTYNAGFLGQKNDLKFTRAEAEKTAKTLSRLGININFAPVVDLDLNKNSKIISGLKRSYSDNPKIVSAHAKEVIEAHNKYGIITTLKHFPGHGSAQGDTHQGFVDITNTHTKEEILPYKTLINEKIAKGVMISHLYNKNIDEKYPASMSYNFVTKKLLKELNYNGLIFTDDIQMNAIRNNYTFAETLEKSIMAGCDVIVIGNNLFNDEQVAKNAVEIIFNLVKNGVIPKERIAFSYDKIIKAKEELKKIENTNRED
ncbi:glycoside hydrolase family 3 protein [bacterium]|nr:glycoside hydrolase family 3 protein [bacterium]